MDKSAVRISIVVGICLCAPLLFSKASNAEKVYCKNGEVVKGKVIYRSKNSLWLDHDLGSFGVSLDKIEKICNDDGSLSKFNYETVPVMIQRLIKEKKYSQAAFGRRHFA